LFYDITELFCDELHPISNLFEWILAKGLFLKDKVFEPMQRFCSLSKVSVA
jgi:hypothetical protein